MGASPKSRPDLESGRPTEFGGGKTVTRTGQEEGEGFMEEWAVKKFTTPEYQRRRAIEIPDSSPEEDRGSETGKEGQKKDEERSRRLRKKYEEARGIIRRLVKDIEDIDERIKACNNTKRDVKEASRKARANADRATRADVLGTMQEMIRRAEERPPREKERAEKMGKEKETRGTQTVGSEREEKGEATTQKAEAETQTENEYGQEDRERDEKRLKAKEREQQKAKIAAQDSGPWQKVRGPREKKTEKDNKRQHSKKEGGREEPPVSQRRGQNEEEWPKVGDKAPKNTRRYRKPTGNNSNTDTLKIKLNEGKTFAEAMKEIRQNVDIEGKSLEIKGVSKSRDGTLKIRIAGAKEGEKEELKEKIMKVESVDSISDITEKISVCITDVMGEVEEAEIMEILKREMEDWKEEPGRLRFSREVRGYKYATIEVTRKVGEALIKRKRIGGKWNHWGVREFLRVSRCYNCRRVGHKGAGCPEERANVETCHRCGEEGHKVAECKNRAYCYLCKGEHKAESLGCQVYRRLLWEERDKKNRT